jgi:hypothetical protein
MVKYRSFDLRDTWSHLATNGRDCGDHELEVAEIRSFLDTAKTSHSLEHKLYKVGSNEWAILRPSANGIIWKHLLEKKARVGLRFDAPLALPSPLFWFVLQRAAKAV